MQVDARAIQRAVYTNSQKLVNPYILIAKADRKQQKLELTVTPRIGFLTPWEGRVLVRVRLHVVDPSRELACPEVTWNWGDETKSYHVEDCDPAALPQESWFSNKHYYVGYGRFVLSVFLKAATATRLESSSVEIR